MRTGGGGETVRCYDKLARETRTATRGFDGAWVHTDTEYDDLGRVKRASEPHYGNQAACGVNSGQSRCWTHNEYDTLSRIVRTLLPDGSAARTSYSGYTTTHTNGLNQVRTVKTNALGETVRTTDHVGGTVEFSHDIQGNLTCAESPCPTPARRPPRWRPR